jgi:hypothetical protein
MPLEDTVIAQWDLFWERQRARSSPSGGQYADRYDWGARGTREPTPHVERAPLGRAVSTGVEPSPTTD